MPLPSGLARFNKRVTNRITSPFARRLAGFGVVHHVGRKTGKPYQTPINCWIDGGMVIVALTYGPDVDWLKNLAAAGGGEIVIQGDTIAIGGPRRLDPEEEALERMPWLARRALRILGVDEFREFPILSS